MSDIAIRVENLGKLYRIGAARERHDTLRDAVSATLQRSNVPTFQRSADFWALRDVSFEVKRGEVIGVIGRNGAGKSTLLKILSRITEPTTGRVELHGRVGSLLEVGTGFHPELTGRENIYLNGAILGMKRAEIARRFDEIVAFAEIERFLETPVKRYSSGMYVRLAFAVAAHLEPEILLVDEVLAVGDAAFQKKCLGKMGEVGKEGRTVVFVSHNMAAVDNLCSRSALLQGGELTRQGMTRQVIEYYVSALGSRLQVPLLERADRTGSGLLRFTGVRLADADGNPIGAGQSGQTITIELDYRLDASILNGRACFSFAFLSTFGHPLFLCRSDYLGIDYRDLPKQGTIACRIPRLPLPEGSFRCNLQAEMSGTLCDRIEDAFVLSVVGGDFYGTGRVLPSSREDLLVAHEWRPVTPYVREGV